MNPSSESLFQTWVHSHEEDQAGQLVFRPSDFVLPPSRGRRAFTIGEDENLMDRRLSANDAPQSATGHWSREQDTLTFVDDVTQKVERWEIVSLEESRLVLQRKE